MNGNERRVRKIESLVGQEGNIEGARALANLGREVGLIAADEVSRFTAHCAEEGITLNSLLRDIDGLTLGPPALRKKEINGGVTL